MSIENFLNGYQQRWDQCCCHGDHEIWQLTLLLLRWLHCNHLKALLNWSVLCFIYWMKFSLCMQFYDLLLSRWLTPIHSLPHSVLRSKFADIIAIIENVFEQHKDEQPIVRSIIGCLQELLAAQDAPNWSMPVTKKAYQQLLILSANASPKVNILLLGIHIYTTKLMWMKNVGP